MKTVIILFLLLFCVGLSFGLIFVNQDVAPQWIKEAKLCISLHYSWWLWRSCLLFEGSLSQCFCKKAMGLRLVSLVFYPSICKCAICGGVSYLFLRAGLLVLESTAKQDASDIGYLVLSFIAGLNVDKFITKIEDIAQATYGIEKE